MKDERAELTGCACRWDKDDNRVHTCERHQGWLDVVHEWAERAKSAEQQADALLAADAREGGEVVETKGKVWAIDHSAGRPILVLNGCSVIEAEDADYVLSLVRGASHGDEATIAGLESATGHLSALVDDLRRLMARAMASMKALHEASKPVNESRGDFDAVIPSDVFRRFVDEHAALLADLHNSPHELPATHHQPQAVAHGWKLVPVEPTYEMLFRGRDVLGGYVEDTDADYKRVYKAMLAASPAAPQAVPPTVVQEPAPMLLRKWNGKDPFAATDTVWIEPAKGLRMDKK
jgi:hypothetical protein